MVKKFFWNTIENYGIYSINKKSSTNSQFFLDEKELHTSKVIINYENKFKNIQKDTIGDYSKKNLSFQSLGYKYKNQVSVDYLYNNKKTNNKNFILIHGWKQTSFDTINNIMMDYITKNNYNVYHFTMQFHMKRKSKNELFSGEYFISSNINRTVEAINQTTSDLINLINYIKNNNSGEIIVIGVSLGGLLSNLINTYLEVDKIISIFYPDNLAYLIYNTPIAKYIKKDLELNNITEKMLIEYWKNIVPSNRIPLKNNILLMSGEYDKFIFINDSNNLWKKWNKPKRLVYETGHAGLVVIKKRLQKDITKFIEGK